MTDGRYINLGSGQRIFDPEVWTNIDSQAKWNPDIVADGASLPMFAESTCEMVVLHHVLEHFGCGEGDAMLRECHRILREGGSLIVSVPDLIELFKAHVRGQIDEQVFLTNVYGAYMGDEADRHKWGYSPQSLAKTLYSAGFSRVRTFDNRPIAGASISADFWILSQEATK